MRRSQGGRISLNIFGATCGSILRNPNLKKKWDAGGRKCAALEQTVAYMDNVKAKKRVTKTCKHCKKTFVFRNVGQLVCHLAAPDSGVGKARYRCRLAKRKLWSS